jgi:hypothetical protein
MKDSGLKMKRAKALCLENVTNFYKNLLNFYEQNKNGLHEIWNVDESEAQTYKNRQNKVID